MTVSAVKRLSNDALRRDLSDIVVHDRTTTARLLIHIGEFDARRLYREDGYRSMHEYCVGELGMSEDVAYKRVRAAKKSRRYPRILLAIADGRLTLSAVAMLSRHFTEQTAEALLTEAERKTNAQVAELIARRFPRPDLPTLVQPILEPEELAVRPILDKSDEPAKCVQEPVLEPVEPARQPAVRPLALERYAVQFTIGREDRELLEQAKALLSHQIPSGDEAKVFLHALGALVRHLEKRKFSTTDKPRKSPTRESRNPRYIPARVRRAVHERDGGRCTFVAENGHRCARTRLEFDHIQEVARGGKSTVGNLRLRCRTHNQYTAEQTYGPQFMRGKREDAARTAAKRRVEEVIPYLRALGCSPGEARQAAEKSEAIPNASMEERVRLAVSQLGPRGYCPRAQSPNGVAVSP